MGRNVGVPEHWSANPDFVSRFQASFKLADANGNIYEPVSLTENKTEMAFQVPAGMYSMKFTNPYRGQFVTYATAYNGRSLGNGANYTVNVQSATNTIDITMRSTVQLAAAPPSALTVPAYDPALSLDDNVTQIQAALPAVVTVYDPSFPTETYQARATWLINTTNVTQFTLGSTLDVRGSAYVLSTDQWDYVYSGPDFFYVPVTAVEAVQVIESQVTFDLNYEGAPEDVIVTTDESGIVTPPETPVREGYQFAGWYLEPDASGQVIDFTSTVFTEATTVYAKWFEVLVPPTVTFNYNYEGGPDDVVVTANESGLVSPPASPIRDGFRFRGWFDNPEGSGQPIAFATTTFTENTTVYAGWQGNTPIMALIKPRPNTIHDEGTIEVQGYVWNIGVTPEVTLSLSDSATNQVIDSRIVEAIPTIINLPNIYTGPGYAVTTTFTDLPDGTYDMRLAAEAAGVADSILSPNQTVDSAAPTFTITSPGSARVSRPDMRTIRVTTDQGYIDLKMIATDENYYVEIQRTNELGTENWDQIGVSTDGRLETTFRHPRAYREGVRELSMGETVLYYRAIDVAGNVTMHRVIVNRVEPRAWITFDYNYEGSPEPVVKQANYNGYVIAPPNPQRLGYRFLGWFDNPEATGSQIIVPRTKFSEDTTLYAGWEANTPLIAFEQPESLDIINEDTISVSGYVYNIASTPNVTIKLYDNRTDELIEERVVEAIPTDIAELYYTGPGYAVSTTFDTPADGPYYIRIEAEAGGKSDSVLRYIRVDRTAPELSITADGAEVVEADDMPTIRIETIDPSVNLDIVASDNWYYFEVQRTDETGTRNVDYLGMADTSSTPLIMAPSYFETTYRLPRRGELAYGETVYYFRAIDMAGNIAMHRVIVERKPLNVSIYLDGELVDQVRVEDYELKLPKFKDLNLDYYQVTTSDGQVYTGSSSKVYIQGDDEVEIHYSTKPGKRAPRAQLIQLLQNWAEQNRWLK